jgi:hypothetical protein
MKLPKPGTNPRGVEITPKALSSLINDGRTKCISINWKKAEIALNPYRRWVDLWRED